MVRNSVDEMGVLWNFGRLAVSVADTEYYLINIIVSEASNFGTLGTPTNISVDINRSRHVVPSVSKSLVFPYTPIFPSVGPHFYLDGV